MKKYVAIFNPVAGGGKGKKILPSVMVRLKQGGLNIDVHVTQAPGDATQLAKTLYNKGERNFLIMGGDGTAFEVINGIFPLKSLNESDRPTLGFLPMGTGNSFLRDFSHDSLEYSIKAILENRSRPCDVIQVQHKKGDLFFMNIFSFGFVANVGATRNRLFHSLGELGYILGVFKELASLHLETYPVQLDQQKEVSEPVTFISINNSKFTGGKMMMAPNANTSDGQADFITVGKMGRFKLLKAFPKIFKGTHIDLPNVTSQQVKNVDFNLQNEIDVMVDGEMVHIQPEHLTVLKHAMEVRA